LEHRVDQSQNVIWV